MEATARTLDFLNSADMELSSLKPKDIELFDETSRDSGIGQDDSCFANSPVKTSLPLNFRTVRSLSYDSPASTASPSLSVFDVSDDELCDSFISLDSVGLKKNDSETTPSVTPVLSQHFDTIGIQTQNGRKRPSPTCDSEDSTPVSKRRRGMGRFRRFQSLDLISVSEEHSVSCNPETEAHIKDTLDRVSEDANLISDGSKSCCLPTIPGKHQDLKSITHETLAKVLNHEYDDVIGRYLIVDCRYPYEYEGGHIEGAQNLYTRDSIMENLVKNRVESDDGNKRTVIIFHCEFSSERGPKLSRFLREMDREANKEHYPALYYPELYLLHGGYKEFYAAQKELCNPQSYVPMRQDDYKEDLKKFRVKSRSWAAGDTSRSSLRRGLKF